MIKSLRLLVAILLILFCSSLYAQRLSGIVLDNNTLLAIPHATIRAAKQSVFTSVPGRFTLTNLQKGDTIWITCVGYKSRYMVFSELVSDTIRIYLEQAITRLNSVVIIGRRRSNADSIRLRKEFAPVFNHKDATIKDAFITHAPDVYRPNDYITSTNNFTTLLSVNLLAVVDLLNRNNAPVSKLQKTLIRDEQGKYVDQVFSKEKVSELTPLKGDSLRFFMDKYRPSIADARSMSDYQVMIYIKKSYAEFVKPVGNGK